ncbi:helicase associated domain-containing protein [Streptomyces sp. XY332]|uniref:helicase associated domain-containing protein n=1 Tax=Streptomyces sp. XY332 TaxID=1415561 RepID=UPI0006B2108A|nr:hypothetical protein ADK59_33480 [Streptomyces sp. XY332]
MAASETLRDAEVRDDDVVVRQQDVVGLEIAVHGNLKVPFTYRVPGGDGQEAEAELWPASLTAFPLGSGSPTPAASTPAVWSHYDAAWEEGLGAARGWATENGHLLAPLDATYQGAKVGIWLKNARVADGKAAENEQRRAEGLPVESSAGALTAERREQLEDIDPSWCPGGPADE